MLLKNKLGLNNEIELAKEGRKNNKIKSNRII